MDDVVWLRCSACKKDIRYGAVHWVCSVSTCNRSRTKLVFCSVICWDSHVAILRHRDSWAVEARAPSRDAWRAELAADANAGVGSDARQPPVRSLSGSPAPRAPAPAPAPAPRPAPAPAAVARPAAPPAPRPAEMSPAEQARRTYATPAPSPSPTPVPAAGGPTGEFDRDMLIVISKMKKYIKDRSGMNCSDAVADVLSDHVRLICDDSIRAAATDNRKTVLDRDVPKPRR